MVAGASVVVVVGAAVVVVVGRAVVVVGFAVVVVVGLAVVVVVVDSVVVDEVVVVSGPFEPFVATSAITATMMRVISTAIITAAQVGTFWAGASAAAVAAAAGAAAGAGAGTSACGVAGIATVGSLVGSGTTGFCGSVGSSVTSAS